MELDFFPSPYPDEHLYGIVGRYHQRAGNTSSKKTSLELFDAGGMCVSVSNIYNLDSLCNKLSQDSLLTADYLIKKHTLLPLYSTFMSAEDVADRIKGICKIVKPIPRTTWDFLRQKTGNNRFLMHCPECIAEDKTIYGESYWHRSHQIHGLDVCNKHGEWLLQSNVLTAFEERQFDYTLPENAVFSPHFGARDVRLKKHIQSLAKSANWLLTYTEKPIHISKVLGKYYKRLSELGYSKNFGFVKEQMLLNDIEKFCISKGSKMIPPDINMYGENQWLLSILKGTRYFNSPINHLLFMHFLEISCGEVVLDPEEYAYPIGRGWPCFNPLVDAAVNWKNA